MMGIAASDFVCKCLARTSEVHVQLSLSKHVSSYNFYVINAEMVKNNQLVFP